MAASTLSSFLSFLMDSLRGRYHPLTGLLFARRNVHIVDRCRRGLDWPRPHGTPLAVSRKPRGVAAGILKVLRNCWRLCWTHPCSSCDCGSSTSCPSKGCGLVCQHSAYCFFACALLAFFSSIWAPAFVANQGRGRDQQSLFIVMPHEPDVHQNLIRMAESAQGLLRPVMGRARWFRSAGTAP